MILARLVAFLALAQVPASFPAGSFVLRGPSSWLLIAPTGQPIVEFRSIDGQALTSVAALPDGKGLLFTGRRDLGQDGLFLKRGGLPTSDLSISPGYHGWPAISPDAKTVVFAHRDSPDSGPIGQHGAMVNAQLWELTLGPKSRSRQLTTSEGCKASPSFYGETRIVYGHNSCRGSQGIETLDTAAKAAPRILLKPEARLEMNPIVSPDRRLVTTARGQFHSMRVLVSSWPDLKEIREIGTTPEGQDSPSANWTADSRFVLLTTGTRVIKVDATTGQSQVVWTFGTGMGEQ